MNFSANACLQIELENASFSKLVGWFYGTSTFEELFNAAAFLKK